VRLSLSRCEVRVHINDRENDHRGLVSFLRSLAAAETANPLHLREFRSPAIFEFFNTIGAKRTRSPMLMSAKCPQARSNVEACRSRLEGVVKSFGGQALQLRAELRRARGAERLFKAALRLLPQLHRSLEFRHPGGRENYPLDPAVFWLGPKPHQAIAHQRTQGMAHSGQIHQQTPGEFRHSRTAEIINLREQAELGCLQAAWLQHGVVVGLRRTFELRQRVRQRRT
jgi:hypothetical protein